MNKLFIGAVLAKHGESFTPISDPVVIRNPQHFYNQFIGALKSNKMPEMVEFPEDYRIACYCIDLDNGVATTVYNDALPISSKEEL